MEVLVKYSPEAKLLINYLIPLGLASVMTLEENEATIISNGGDYRTLQTHTD